MTTWTQTEEPHDVGRDTHWKKHTQQIETLGRTHKATLVMEDSTDFNIINPTFPCILFYFCLVCCQLEPCQKSDLRDFLPAAGGLLIPEHSLLVWN